MPSISNHKYKIEEKSTQSSRSSSKVVGLGPVDLWEFPKLIVRLKNKVQRNFNLDSYILFQWNAIKTTLAKWRPYCPGFDIQSSVVITRSNIKLYCKQQCSDWDRNWPEVEITKDTPYLALTGEIWSVYCEDLGEIDCIATLSHCIDSGRCGSSYQSVIFEYMLRI